MEREAELLHFIRNDSDSQAVMHARLGIGVNFDDGSAFPTPLENDILLGGALVRQLVEGGADVDRQGPFGVTPLGWAVAMGQPDSARILAEAGAAPPRRGTIPPAIKPCASAREFTEPGAFGLNPLMWAIIAGGRAAAARFILAAGLAGADLDRRVDARPGGCPVEAAVLLKRFTALRALAACGAEPTAEARRLAGTVGAAEIFSRLPWGGYEPSGGDPLEPLLRVL